MVAKPFIIQQDIFRDDDSLVEIREVHINQLTSSVLDKLDVAQAAFIGLAPVYNSRCALTSIALASKSYSLIIRLGSRKDKKESSRKILNSLLCDKTCRKMAFNMDGIAIGLYLDCGLYISKGFDLSVSRDERGSIASFMSAVGGESKVHQVAAMSLFEHELPGTTPPIRELAMRAWAACHAGTSLQKNALQEIDTTRVIKDHLEVLSKAHRDQARSLMMKPTYVKNDLNRLSNPSSEGLQIFSERYKTRVRLSSNQRLIIEFRGASGERLKTPVRVVGTRGKMTVVNPQVPCSGKKILSAHTVGREDLTYAEAQRESIILTALQSKPRFLESSLAQKIWLPSMPHSPASTAVSRLPASLNFSYRSLNMSQRKAVEAILSNDEIDIIHGPPGTGKTTVIAAAVNSIMNSADRGRTLWLVAQSNVAVKNMAQKLGEIGFQDFRLLISKEFYFEWHEHLYEQQLLKNTIVSNDFPPDVVQASRLLLGSRVILCTLSMLCNPSLAFIIRLVPVETVIIDEASQIECGDYIPLISMNARTLRKLVFIGDDKQLPPYGHEDLLSIFERTHLRKTFKFLSVQYRIPHPIGEFISAEVYGGRLKTVHKIKSPSCCRFVDIENGKEEMRNKSFVNFKEVQAVLKIAKKYQSQSMGYRIITPYDGQRNALEKGLKTSKLSWEDKCFCVDSFQGNEEDHIIISLVRTEKQGFLKDVRRMNVMLTRCKKSMIICTNRKFLTIIARDTLVGKLAATDKHEWLSRSDILSGRF